MAIRVADIRRRKQAERLSALQQQANVVLGEQPGGSLWLFGSWARGDWDGFSGVDVMAIASNRDQASGLADAVLRHGMADDVLALKEQAWQERRNGNAPLLARHRTRCRSPERTMTPSVDAWMRQANSDWALAELTAKQGFHSQVCYHYGQAA